MCDMFDFWMEKPPKQSTGCNWSQSRVAEMQSEKNKHLMILILNKYNTLLFYVYYQQVLSIVQLVGIVLCLSAAAKISHRAQSLGAIASRWHALVTCNSNDEILENDGNGETRPPSCLLTINYSESDMDSSDYVPLPTSVQLTSSMSSYQRRQAFGMYIIKFLRIITKS